MWRRTAGLFSGPTGGVGVCIWGGVSESETLEDVTHSFTETLGTIVLREHWRLEVSLRERIKLDIINVL